MYIIASRPDTTHNLGHELHRVRNIIIILLINKYIDTNYTIITINNDRKLLYENLWWATGTHLNNLKERIGNKYLDPEMYLLNKIKINNKDDKVYQSNPLCIYKSIGNHAGANYDPSIYQNLSVSEILDRIPTNYIYNNHGDNIPKNINRITFG
uniref:Uncharacterized protein n=1 Tax=viral metagenome TaxID=1070528 RepID=A0A6C0LY01_9ZZZZ